MRSWEANFAIKTCLSSPHRYLSSDFMLVTFGWRMKGGFFILIFEPSSPFLNKDMILHDTKGLGEVFPYSYSPLCGPTEESVPHTLTSPLGAGAGLRSPQAWAGKAPASQTLLLELMEQE